jgi:acyl dehydratase
VPVVSALRHFEDFAAGDAFDLGAVTVTEADIVEFASVYDPQPFHVDPAMTGGPFGGLVASGWHTTALLTRGLVEHLLAETAACGGWGVESLRWLVPLRPGDVLRSRATIVETRPSRTKDWRGTVTYQLEAVNQRDELAVRWVANFMVARRNAA